MNKFYLNTINQNIRNNDFIDSLDKIIYDSYYIAPEVVCDR